jgi:cytochrome c peroxidase
MRSGLTALLGAGLLASAGALGIAAVFDLRPFAALAQMPATAPPAAGENPHPIHLVRPSAGPLSAMAELGRLVFFDPGLSSSGKLSCASCHSPEHAYAAPGELPAMLGGHDMLHQGARAVPSLMYLEHQPPFSIGPDNEEFENVSLADLVAASAGAPRVQKTAPQAAKSAANLVPQGGLFWDGRANTLQDQAMFPLLDAREMDGGSVETVGEKLQKPPYVDRMLQLFGPSVFNNPRFAVEEALFAVGRYQIEDSSFHPYTSKFDYWLEGKASFTPSELRGYISFNDPAKANCGGCHADQPGRDGLPPLFTDHQYESLGAPRNGALAANQDPGYFDLGICGPYRSDMPSDTQYCGLFTTPTLRNVATRRVFFHNGVYRTLQQVLDFYNFRDTAPERIYPRNGDGTVRKYDDLPGRYQSNVDVADPPFDRNAGDTPAMTAQDEDDIIAFLQTLNDGYEGR